jgi:hypothetical protein
LGEGHKREALRLQSVQQFNVCFAGEVHGLCYDTKMKYD